ncbi:MAG: hypothetical protein R2754_05720 [Microthrixaceae bacterium]
MNRVGVLLGVAGVLVTGTLLSAGVMLRDPATQERSDQPVTYGFDGRAGLMTNEYAHWNPSDPKRTAARDWVMTSGSVFRRDGHAWTGELDDISPDVASERSTNSAVFRLFTRRSDWRNTSVTIRYRVLSRRDQDAHDYDGLHLLLRARQSTHFYSVSLDRRDGEAVVKRKLPGVDDDPYETLAAAPLVNQMGRWRTAVVRLEDLSSGAVAIDVSVDGQQVLGVLDHGLGGRGPLRDEGQIGVRGDNTEFELSSVEVAPL